MKRACIVLQLGAMLLLLGAVPARSGGSWWNSNWHFRVPLTLSAGVYDRFDKPVDVAVNFTSILSSLGRSGAFDDASIHVVEVNGSGTVIDTAAAFQFDRASAYNSSSNAAGTLIVLMKGTTTAGTQRFFDVYFDVSGGTYVRQSVSPRVSYVDNVSFAGQASYEISTSNATYYYHKFGGGFAGMKDKDGLEWLGYDPTPGSGASGEYRGMPNAVYNPPNPGFFHPGFTNSTSSVVSSGPLKMTINTHSTDGGNPWECMWEVYPTYATMTMLTLGNSTYWFLFEGTPGGTYDPATDYVVRSTGEKNSVSDSWEGAIPSPEFAYFGDANLNRVAYVVHHEADNRIDSYRPLNDAMTIFGFGRDIVVGSYFDVVPQHFTAGFSEDSSFAGASKVIASSFRPTSGSIGQAEELALAAPSLISPPDNGMNLPSTVPFLWHSAAGATAYRLQIARDASFVTNVVFDDSTLVDTARTVGGLPLNAILYWRVRASKAGLSGPYSSVWDFATGIAAPVPLFPIQGATGQATSLTVRWSSVPGAQSYRLQLGTDSTFLAGVVLDDSLIVDTSRAAGPLAGGTKYFWRVYSKNSGGSSQPSAVSFFTTGMGSPILSAPSDNTSIPGTATVLKWFRVGGAAAYHVQVSTDNGFVAGIFVNDSTVVDTLKAVSGLSTGVRYFWRVRALSGGVSGAFASPWSFIPALPSPVLISPPDRAVRQPLAMSMLWRRVQGSTAYHLQLGTDSTFSSGMVKNDSTIVDTARVVAGLKNSTRYFWRVSAMAGPTHGVFSGVWSFGTEAAVPGIVQLVSPANGALLLMDSVALRWNSTQPAASRYMVELSIDSLFVLRSVDSTLTDTVKIGRGFTRELRYWWRVRGGNAETWGPVSETRTFIVTGTAVENRSEAMPRAFALSQNYPNPFNPSTVIDFAVPRGCHVVLKVYDILGGEVATLVDEFRAPGLYRIRFDASLLTSGMYLYRLVTPEGALQQKMLLVK